MNIAGFQKLSLVDYPGIPCAIVFTQGCLLRCGYCHNPSLIPLNNSPRHTVDEILAKIEANKKMVDAVCITGGEPTLHKGLVPFMRRLKDLGFRVKLDTNGIRPAAVEEVIASRVVDYFAMDIKAPWEKYLDVIGEGRQSFVDECQKTLQRIQESGIDHEFRTTIHPGVHTQDDLVAIASYLKPGEKYFVQKTSFREVLDPALPRTMQFDPRLTVDMLIQVFPQLSIELR